MGPIVQILPASDGLYFAEDPRELYSSPANVTSLAVVGFSPLDFSLPAIASPHSGFLPPQKDSVEILRVLGFFFFGLLCFRFFCGFSFFFLFFVSEVRALPRAIVILLYKLRATPGTDCPRFWLYE